MTTVSAGQALVPERGRARGRMGWQRSWFKLHPGVPFSDMAAITSDRAVRDLLMLMASACPSPDTHVFLLGYDMTNPASLENMEDWLEEVTDTWEDFCGIIMVGTKYDLWLEKKEAGADVCTEDDIAAVTNGSAYSAGG